MNQRRKSVFLAIALGSWSCALQAQSHELQLSLEELFDLADKQNRSSHVMRLAEEEAQQAIKVAQSSQMPDIEANLSVSYLGDARIWDRDFSNGFTADMPHFGNNFALEATQVIYTGGAISANIELAKLRHRMSQVNREANTHDVRFMLTSYYLDLFRLMNQEKVYQKNIEQTNMLIAEINAKHAQGVALRNDVTRYELQLKTYELAITQLRNSRNIINSRLCTALGLEENTIIGIDTTMIQRLPDLSNEAEWQSEANLHAIGPKLSSLGIDMAKQQERLAKSERLPSVALFAGDKLDGPITIEVPPLDQNLNYWYVGVGVKYSLSSLFKSNRKTRLARLATERAEESHRMMQDNMRSDTKEVYIRFQEAFVIYETQQKSLSLAMENYTVASNRYLNELALITDMLDASNAKLNAELQVVNAQINILFNYYKLKRTTGTL